MRRALRIPLLTTLAALVVPLALAEDSPHRYVLPSHGSLALILPATWKDQIAQPPEGLPPTITVRAGGDQGVVMMITPLWSPRGDAQFNAAPNVRRLVEQDRDGLASQAEEKEIPVRSLGDADGRGFYFKATDARPKPGDPKYLIRAGRGVGELLLGVTILSHRPDDPAVEQALKSIREARHLP